MLTTKSFKSAPLWLSLPMAALLSACGTNLVSGLDSSDAGKNPCPGDHQGFFICMSNASQISDANLEKIIVDGLGKLIALVNGTAFQGQVKQGFTQGQSIVDSLSQTNYIVTITGYCSSGSDVLASAVVGGDTIQYNECTVQKDDSGNIDEAAVSGVLLHEISHNIGYTHPAVNPSRSTVPYWLGDQADDDLAPAQPAASGTPQSGTAGSGSTHQGRKHYVIGD